MDLSQDALGARFNVTGQMIGHIESGKRMASPEMSKGFDALFGLDQYFEELWWHVRRGRPQTGSRTTWMPRSERPRSELSNRWRCMPKVPWT
jgi:hypothetical protein